MSCFVMCRSTVWHLQLVSCVLSIISHSHLWSRKTMEWFLAKKWWHCCRRAHGKPGLCNSASLCWSWSSCFCTHIGAWTSFWVPAPVCTTLPWVPTSPEACLSFEASPFQFSYNTLHPALLTESWNCPKKSEKFTFQCENNCSFNTACHSSLLNKCSGNAFPIATFLILMGFGNRSGFSLWSFTINLRQV